MSEATPSTGTTEQVRAAHRELGQMPGLDGLRGVGVLAAVVAHASYHSGSFSMLRGTFFAVLMFFVLSGFLITSLLLLELDIGGRIGLRAFWSRRYRRLVPAALVGVVVVLAYGWFAGDSTQMTTLRGDVAAAVTYTTNWRQLFAGQVYANQLGSPTPLLHYWSLAIEEQFYLVLPLVLIAAHRVGRGSRRAIPIALGALSAASLLVVTVLASSDDLNPDRLYYGTDARALEFLAGALLGVWFVRHRDAVARHARAIDAVGWVGFVLSMVLWQTTDLADTWIYRGGLQLGILPAVAMVLGAAAGGSLSSALSFRPLREVGRISYGVYVLHWPIILWITPERTGLDAGVLVPIQMAVVVAAAACSFVLIESPVRRGKLLASRGAAIGAAVGFSALLVVASTAVVDHGPASAFDFDESQREVDEASELLGDVDAPRIGFFGDSTSTLLAQGVYRWSAETRAFAAGGTRNTFGCGIVDTANVIALGELQVRDGCPGWEARWQLTVDSGRPDLSVVSIATDVTDQQLPDGTYAGIDDPAFEDHLRQQMLRAVDILTSHGGHVVWLRQPHVHFGAVDGAPPFRDWPENDPARMDAYNDLVDEVASLRPGEVTVLDFGTYLRSLPDGELDARLRPDLLHLTDASATEIAYDWLGPALLEVADSLPGIVAP